MLFCEGHVLPLHQIENDYRSDQKLLLGKMLLMGLQSPFGCWVEMIKHG